MRTALLIPCFKAGRFLRRLREQVDRMNPAFDEVLLADDASGDGTAEQAEALGFTILRLPKNRGPGGARNALAQATTADWIHFHDVDDELAPDYLSRVRSQATASVDAVFHFVDFIDEVTRAHIIRWSFVPGELESDPAATLLRQPMPTPSSFLRRSTFLSLGGFDEKHRCFEDGDFNFRLGGSGARIACVPEVLEWSLRHEGGLGADQRYCFQCRLEYLESYVGNTPERLHPVIAQEAERTAAMLLRFGDRPRAQRAVDLCHRLGHAVPHTRHPLFRGLRLFIPALVLLRWQDQRRLKHQNSSR